MNWYGGRRKVMQVFSRTGLWHRRGCDPVALRCVRARDPEGEQADAAYFCTDDRFLPEEILKYVVQRWSVEVTFEEARAHCPTLGSKNPRLPGDHFQYVTVSVESKVQRRTEGSV